MTALILTAGKKLNWSSEHPISVTALAATSAKNFVFILHPP
jgi:hypothetical protein